MTDQATGNDICGGGRPALEEIRPAELGDMLRRREVMLLDVREPGEYEAERIPGALLLPLSGFDPACLPPAIIPSVVLMCGSGKRSAQAAQRLTDVGATRTAHLAGGIMAWKQAGLPTIAFDPATGAWRLTRND